MSSSAHSLVSDAAIGNWLSGYERANPDLLRDRVFAAWLKTEYTPIAGGWQY